MPDGAVVEVSNEAGPQLSAPGPRAAVGRPAALGAVGRRRRRRTPTFPLDSVSKQRERVRYLLSHGYAVAHQGGGYVVLNRPGSVPDLRATR